MLDTNLPVIDVMVMSQMCVVLPLCTRRPVACTLFPTLTGAMWFPLTCMPKGISSGSQYAHDPYPANDSANASDAPPCSVPYGWQVRWSTGISA